MNQNILQVYNNIQRNIFSLYVTGGGIQSLNWLFTVPGASRSIIQAGIPYSRSSLNEILGESSNKNQQSCSSNTTELLAIEAFKNCISHTLYEERSFSILSSSNLFGIACSAALVSNTPKKGSHRCYISSANTNSIKTWSLTLSKENRTREEEDYVCSRIILNSILENSNVPIPPIDYLLEGEVEQFQSKNRQEEMIDKLYKSEIGMILFVKKTSSNINNNKENNNNPLKQLENEFNMFDDINLPPGSIIYPGSFNPLHEGHVQLVKITLSELDFQFKQINNNDNNNSNETQQIPIVFEIAVINADKPPLSRDDLIKRIMAFSSSGLATQLLENFGLSNVAIVVTSQPLFVNKVNLFPNCQILLGADTLSRLLNEKYYNNSRENMILALGKILQKNNLIVGGRVSSEGEFITAENILLQHHLPTELTQKILSLPESSFRCDISSTAIRNMIQNHQST